VLSFSGAYLQPELQPARSEAEDQGWYDEDSPETVVDESSLKGTDLWGWKVVKAQHAIRYQPFAFIGVTQ